jgi:hypothetical protein
MLHPACSATCIYPVLRDFRRVVAAVGRDPFSASNYPGWSKAGSIDQFHRHQKFPQTQKRDLGELIQEQLMKPTWRPLSHCHRAAKVLRILASGSAQNTIGRQS